MKITKIKIKQASIEEYGYVVFTLSNDWYRETIGETSYIPFSGDIRLPFNSENANMLLDKFRNNEYIELEMKEC